MESQEDIQLQELNVVDEVTNNKASLDNQSKTENQQR